MDAVPPPAAAVTPTPEEIVHSLPCWRGAPIIAPLRGGLSNASFKVVDAGGVHVARIGRDYPFHHVSRAREAEAALAAAAIGLSPAVRFVGDGALVTDFVEGRTLETRDLSENIEPIVALLRRCHVEMRARVRGAAAMFWVFHVIRDYAETLRAGGHSIAPELPRLVAEAAALEAAQVPLPIVFGHHDLLPGNFIDDGKRLWLIDWEYAGFGTAMFDLANLADNGEFDPTTEDRLLGLYFGSAPDAATRRGFDAMKVASALREMLWAMVSELRLATPGVDYAAYAAGCREKFERARNSRGPR
jgi:thiamine kinase-like enzyme